VSGFLLPGLEKITAVFAYCKEKPLPDEVVSTSEPSVCCRVLMFRLLLLSKLKQGLRNNAMTPALTAGGFFPNA